MGGKKNLSVRKHKRLRQERRAWIVAVLLFCVIMAVTLYGGFLIGYSYREYMEEGLPPENLSTGIDSAEEAIQIDDWDGQWNLVLVNKWNPVPTRYEVNLVDAGGGERVDERIYASLMEMLEDGKEANGGQMPRVVSGYRTAQKQQKLYDKKIKEYRKQGYSASEAEELAQQWVAVPGYSEHQLGLAVDINGAAYDFYFWLQENSYKYGFIFRYPGDKTESTGVAEEVWHYRYVGVEAATEIYEQGICLEEYLADKTR